MTLPDGSTVAWELADQRHANEQMNAYASKSQILTNAKHKTAELFDDKQRDHIFDPDFDEVRMRHIMLGDVDAWYSEYYQNGPVSAGEPERLYRHVLIAPYRDGCSFNSRASMTKAQMLLFRRHDMQAQYVDGFLKLARMG